MSAYIPFELRILINQIDPRLDTGWQNKLTTMFNQIEQDICQSIYKQILLPKNIHWDSRNNQFDLIKKTNFVELVGTIRHPGMKQLAEKISFSLEQLKTYTDVEDISDFLESILSQIQNIDVEENLELQQAKQQIKHEFIYSAADVIRAKDTLIIPHNERQLSVEVVKNFILEVYLKKELLGLAFKTIRPYQLLEQNYEILKDFLANEQKTRQLEVVQTSSYIFALAPSTNININPFSVRRFLNEETLMMSDNLYINGAFLNLSQLNEENKSFKWQVSRIITIEKQISQQILDLVDQLEKYNTQQLRPLLFNKLEANGLSTDRVVQQRLWDFEQKLSVYILEKLDHALATINHQDEYDYLFISTNQIMADIISYFKDFSTLSSTMFNNKVSLFIGRLTAYLQLLQKKQSDIFSVLKSEVKQQNKNQMSEPINDLKKVCKDAVEETKAVRFEIKDIEKSLEQKSFFSNIFSSVKKKQEKIQELKAQDYQIRENTYLEIVRIPKKYQNLTVYLEFEALISINTKERHYAFSTGDNWVKRLPLLVQLPEDRTLFNARNVLTTLEFDLSQVNQKWSEAVKGKAVA